MRIYFYTISGIVSTMIGWNISQFLLIGTGESIGEGLLPLPEDFPQEPIVIPIVAVCLAIAMVVTEIFLSNPTRDKANKRVLPPYLWAALGMGTFTGLVAAALALILYQTGAPDWSVRIVTWSLVGLFTGLGEGISWRFRSIEGATSKANARIWKATLFGLGAGLAAALLVEILRRVLSLEGYEDPVGLLILGFSLGLSLSFATSSTYQVALRAGEGFEAIDPNYALSPRPRPKLNHSDLKFVAGEYDFIEEGLSIQLPSKTSEPLTIGSAVDADIYIPDIPEYAASLQVSNRQVNIRCITEKAVQIQRRILVQGGKPKPLSHNQILTFYHQGDNEKYYRFVFYDRFLDPEA